MKYLQILILEISARDIGRQLQNGTSCGLVGYFAFTNV